MDHLVVMSVELPRYGRNRRVPLNTVDHHPIHRVLQLRNEWVLEHEWIYLVGQVCIMFSDHSIDNTENGKKQQCQVAMRFGAGCSKQDIRPTWVDLQIIKTSIKRT